MKDYVYSEYDIEAAKIINDFLPEKLFDAHMHISHINTKREGCNSFDKYYEDIKLFTKDRIVLCNGIIFPEIELKNEEELDKSNVFLANQLEKYPENVGEIMVFPEDSIEDIKKRIIHPHIKGLKCYHIYSDRPDTLNANIEEFLPESAWQVAEEKKMVITLHMVKDEALAHPDNLNYIIKMSKQYPEAVLILAHAARAFASWTVFDTVDKLKNCENVWFDFSGICESPAMQYIIKKIGVKRCMWGTDYPISMLAGKAISVADGFYWLSAEDISQFNIKSWHVGTESFMALRQMCILEGLARGDIEDLFYNNAHKLFIER